MDQIEAWPDDPEDVEETEILGRWLNGAEGGINIDETSSGRVSILISAEGVVVVEVLLLAGGETVVTLVTVDNGTTETGGGGGHRIGGGGAIFDGC